MVKKELSERKLRILKCLVAEFIETAEPVSSGNLARRDGLDSSPATIRNEMVELEEMGYLSHPYTSAGRVPSDKTYRLYVDEMMREHHLPLRDRKRIAARLKNIMDEVSIGGGAGGIANALAEEAKLTSFVMGFEEEFVFGGMGHIFMFPEFRDSASVRPVFDFFSDRDAFFELLTERGDGIEITIGGENADEHLKGSSLITATYHSGECEGDGRRGRLGVIGPTRIDYGRVTSIIEFLTQSIDDALKDIKTKP
jgi:transcriptional regulator of heat shock response